MDFLGHLVDAPLANILIIAGLLFLGIGAVGKVTGKIEPDKMGRMIAGLLGIILLAAGVVTHIRSDSATPNQSQSTVQPVVRVFSVTPAQVSNGGTVTISWDVLNADNVELEPFGQVPPTGDRMVQPEQTTIYRLNATNKAGGKSGTFQEVIVERNPPPTSRTRDDGNTSTENPDSSDDSVYAPQPPPPIRIDETLPSAPGSNYRWTPGSWYYDHVQSGYYWVPGAWVAPPDGDVWTPPYWEYDRGRYRWHHGYWGPHRGYYGGIDYGFGYDGSGYDRSRRNTSSLNRVSYNGGPGGIQQKPTSRELAANQDKHIGALDEQIQLARLASKDPKQFSKYNHPPMPPTKKHIGSATDHQPPKKNTTRPPQPLPQRPPHPKPPVPPKAR